MENQEKNLRKESVHIAIPKDVGLSKLKNIYVSFFLSGEHGALFCESTLKTSANGVSQCKLQVAVISQETEKMSETVGYFA